MSGECLGSFSGRGVPGVIDSLDTAMMIHKIATPAELELAAVLYRHDGPPPPVRYAGMKGWLVDLDHRRKHKKWYAKQRGKRTEWAGGLRYTINTPANNACYPDINIV